MPHICNYSPKYSLYKYLSHLILGSDVDDLSELGDSDDESDDDDDDFTFMMEWGVKFETLNIIFNPAPDTADEDV